MEELRCILYKKETKTAAQVHWLKLAGSCCGTICNPLINIIAVKEGEELCSSMDGNTDNSWTDMNEASLYRLGEFGLFAALRACEKGSVSLPIGTECLFKGLVATQRREKGSTKQHQALGRRRSLPNEKGDA